MASAAAKALASHLKQAALLNVAGLVALLVCGVLSARQLHCWRNGVALFQQAAALDTGNWIAELGLGMALTQERRFDEALLHLNRARNLPGNAFEAEKRLGICYQAKGDATNARKHFQYAVAWKPGSAEAREYLNGLAATAAGLQ
jgi:Flp pilus assembly protein TadD